MNNTALRLLLAGTGNAATLFVFVTSRM